MLLRGEVADDPAEAVHRQEAALRLLRGDTRQGAHELGPREAQLLDERMDHAPLPG